MIQILKEETKPVLFCRVDNESFQAAAKEFDGTIAIFIDQGDLQFYNDNPDGSKISDLCVELFSRITDEDGVVVY